MLPTGLTVDFIDHDRQAYVTVGNWEWQAGGTLFISVSRTPTPLYGWLVAIHEIVEAILCLWAGITEALVTDWDVEWEKQPVHLYDEPGDDPTAPYHKQHVLAGLVERAVAFCADIDWDDYEREITELWNSTRKVPV